MNYFNHSIGVKWGINNKLIYLLLHDYNELQISLLYRDTKVLAHFWMHHNVSSLKGKANEKGAIYV